MSEVNEEKVADLRAKLEASNERSRELLRKVVEIAEHALAHQPENVRENWCHFNAAVFSIRKELRPNPKTLAFVNEKWWYKMNDPMRKDEPSAETDLKEIGGDVQPTDKPLNPDAPEMVRGEKPDEKKAIGNFAGVGKVVSYAIGRDMTVTVTARTAGEGEWVFEGIKDGKLVIEGNILGGKWAAAQYCKFLRNGIVSRAKKVWKNHHRRAEKAAAALAGAPSDAAGAEEVE